jgi:predicted nuclease of restriction endonuclease-like RecB superfamily
MLPGELLITRTKKDRIYPVFAEIDEEHQELAGEFIEVYRNFVGKKKSEIDEILVEFEQGLNFKLVRGLRTLLERRCIFKSKFAVEPVVARRAVFEAASSKKVTNRKERAEVIENVAKKLNISGDDLEHSLWADQESEVILDDFKSLTHEELLKSYNLSLAQTLLFKATGMAVSFKSNYKEIFRAIKYFGLMYSPVGNKVRVEGASSLLKLSERYGTSLARLLPVIVNSDEWAIDAEIVIRRDTPRIYHFVMDSRDRDLLMSGELEREETAFDSGIEERFYNEFISSLASKNWELIREPDAVFTESKAVFIPDFKFKHKEMGIETYFEIVGFWTEEYIKRKLSKLRALPFNILVAIDKNLACFNSAYFELGLNQPVILFSRKVPVGDVVRYLAKIEGEEIKNEVERLKFRGTQIELEGDIISVKDIAMRHNISKEAVRACLNNPEYVVFKEVVVKKELLNEVKGKLVSKNIKLYVEARKAIEEVGLPNPDEVLAKIGFTVKWKGLDIGAVTIELQ